MRVFLPTKFVNFMIAGSFGGPPVAPKSQRWWWLFGATKVTWHRFQTWALLRAGEFPSPGVRRAVVHFSNCRADWLELRKPVPTDGPQRTLLYFHGGGFVMGSARSHQGMVARMMKATGTNRALNVNYRMAPRHVSPAWVDDAFEAYRHMLTRVEPEDILLSGESAGAGLVLSLLQRIRDEKLPMPRLVALFSPWADYTATAQDYANEAVNDPRGPHTDGMLRAKGLDTCAQFIADAAGIDRADPMFSSAFADFTPGMPPLLLAASDGELLRRDTDILERRYISTGHQPQVLRVPDAPHAWILLGEIKIAHTTFEWLAEHVDKVWAGESWPAAASK